MDKFGRTQTYVCKEVRQIYSVARMQWNLGEPEAYSSHLPVAAAVAAAKSGAVTVTLNKKEA
jgi:hypothetical protein